MPGRVVLIVLDGWGIAPAGPGNAISLARTPNFDLFWSKYPHTLLAASGEAVGLPEGQIGNSEVGHLNLGSGRVVWQDLPRITKSVRDKSFFKNEALNKMFDYAKKHDKPVHLLGMVSPGGVHSHTEHLYAILELAKSKKINKVYIHAITDGRDVKPSSAGKYIKELENKITEIGIGEIATISGRYYAMDRDHRWDRTNLAYNAIVSGKGELCDTAIKAINNSYKKDITDEFIRPTVLNNGGVINDGDAILFFNFRGDRPRQLTKALTKADFSGFKREKVLQNLYFVTMTEYEKGLSKNVAFEKELARNCLAEVLEEYELKQFHIAETEKYPHVTYFFNGGVEDPKKGEDRKMIPSPRVATYDLKPEMSAPQIATEVTEKIGKYDFVLINFANLDMVGHTGKIPETIKAIETVDACLGGVVVAAKSAGYEVVITADHGNAEKMLHPDGSPCTAHTLNPVPFILVSKNYKRLKYVLDPMLGNVAPTILDIMNIKKPAEMTQGTLVGRKE